MVSPLQNLLAALDSDLDCLHASQAPGCEHEHTIVERRTDEAAGDDDLQRIERSLQWLKRERMIAALEAGLHGRNHRRRLPRAGQLLLRSDTPVGTEHKHRRWATSTIQLAPPLAAERLQAPVARRPHPYNLRGALWLLIGSAVAGTIAYHVLVGELFSALEPAQAASLQAR